MSAAGVGDRDLGAAGRCDARRRAVFGRGVAALAALAALLTGCSGAPEVVAPQVRPDTVAQTSPPQGPDAARSTAIATGDLEAATSGLSVARESITHPELIAIGEEMSAALASSDVEQWMALTKADDAAAQQLRDWFEGVQAVPMSVREIYPVELLEPQGPDGAVAEFGFRYQVSDADPDPVLAYYEFTLTEEPDGWKLATMVSPPHHEGTNPMLWDLGPITVAEGLHVVVISSTSPVDRAQVEMIDRAVGSALTVWPLDGVERLVVELVGPSEMALIAGGDDASDYNWLYHLPLDSPVVDHRTVLPRLDRGSVSLPRLTVRATAVSDEHWYYGPVSGGSPTVRDVTLTALAGLHQRFWAPSWLTAGLPSWFSISGDPVVAEAMRPAFVETVRGSDEGPQFPPATEWDPAAGLEVQDLRFSEAVTLFACIDDLAGHQATLDLGYALLQLNHRSLHAEGNLDEAFREHLGVGTEDVERKWLACVDEQFGDG